mmetsp:Transcript_11994/g.23100  ORF Transcript_11994/g.23100 Transcript_11994/m.23100 type:complete len:323 (-) Transcript_11994:246-1214(-)
MDRIYSAEQITVPTALPAILKDFAREVLRHQPQDIPNFGAGYFASAKKGTLADFLKAWERGETKLLNEGKSETLTADEEKEVLELFAKVDLNNSGSLERDELSRFDKNGKLFAALDTSKDGEVSEEEYLGFFKKLKAKNPKAVQGYLAYAKSTLLKLTSDEEKAVLHLFDTVDSEGSGMLEADDLSIFDANGKFFKALDSSKDGQVSKKEYLAFFQKLKVKNPKSVWGYLKYAQKCLKKLTVREEKEVKALFDTLDADKSGELELKELAKFDKNGRFFAKLDTSKDGKINTTEYMSFFKSLKEKKPKAVYGYLRYAKRVLKA